MDIVVIKIGSSIITSDRGLNKKQISHISKSVSDIQDMGYGVVLVSSGAVSAGRVKLGLKGRIQDITLKQAAAAIGQSSLVWAYEQEFSEKFNKKVAQILLTRNVFSNRQRYINVKNTLLRLLSLKVIPIVNENDTVSFDEIKFGDNDRLAALVAVSIEAKKLVILSDIDGLYTDNPTKNPEVALINIVDEITPEIMSKAKGAGSISGTGGMYSKLIAAKIAVDHAITVQIINGKRKNLLTNIFSGKDEGTIFLPKTKRYKQRKGWIAAGLESKGTLTLDDGAIRAVLERGKSLLPSGITKVDGRFERGDAVYLACQNGEYAAKGLINYNKREVTKIMGAKSSEITDLLGYKYSDEVVHRDNMTILT